MLRAILIGVPVILIGFGIVFAMQPADFRITRTATISASPADVFAQVNDFTKWQNWSPWAKLDPTAKSTFEGPAAGTGARVRWAGNNQVGEGRMTITDNHPSDLIHIELEFLKPFKATNTAEFTFKPEGNQTLVSWSMFGKNNFMGKAMGLIMDCDRMLGGQFEQGLANMKSAAENGQQTVALKER